MPHYLVAVYHPDDYDPSVETEATIEQIHALNRELIAAGARKFACGLSPASNAKSLRAQPDGTVLVTDGPYLETKEHIGGFWILEAADLDEALAWARKGAVVCRASGEVRPIFFSPDPKGATEKSGRRDFGICTSRSGELFYRNATKWMAARVHTSPVFTVEKLQLMFEGDYINVLGTEYDVAPDGSHFVMIEAAEPKSPPTELSVILNWFAELQRLVPANKESQ
jgi:hypothetical protein